MLASRGCSGPSGDAATGPWAPKTGSSPGLHAQSHIKIILTASVLGRAAEHFEVDVLNFASMLFQTNLGISAKARRGFCHAREP